MSLLQLAIPLFIGFMLDAILGDPYWMPHPIRLFGHLIGFFERHLNRGNYRTLKGIFVALTLIVFTAFFFYGLNYYLAPFPFLYYPLATVFVYFGLANRCLIHEVRLVNEQLTKYGLEAGRKQLSFIVGRDTTNLTANQIRTSALETLSENLSDGVIAPLFYYFIGGLPLMFAYKMTNTLDSMIGYKSPRFKQFGHFAARFDDVLNFIPSRLTAFLMASLSLSWRSFQYIYLYARNHTSPNSGYPESALAGILFCRFGGPNVYQGQLVEKPYIGYNDREISNNDITRATRLNFLVSVVFVTFIIVFWCFWLF